MRSIPFQELTSHSAQEIANAANRKTINNADIITATTEHLGGIGGDVNAADELRRVLDEELAGTSSPSPHLRCAPRADKDGCVAFRVNQENIKAAKAAGVTTAGGSKRGFPGRKKDGEGVSNAMGNEASAGVDKGSLGDAVAAEGGDVPLGGEDDEEIDDGYDDDDDDDDGEAGGEGDDVEAEEMIEELAAGGAEGSDEEMS